MSKETNTTPFAVDEEYDDNASANDTARERTLQNEHDLLQGLLDCGKERNNAESYESIQIRRKGKLKFEFRIRPITEDESRKCYARATKYAPKKANQPRIALDTDASLARSYLIYTATVDEDRARVWDNKTALEAFNLVQGVELIDRVLLAGEKDRIVDKISEISGFGDDGADLDEQARD